MKTMIVETDTERIQLEVAVGDIFLMAGVFEESPSVKSYYVQGLNAWGHPVACDRNKYKKWFFPATHYKTLFLLLNNEGKETV